jgi:hypothetical protein
MQIAHTVTLYAVHRSAATCGLGIAADDKCAIEFLPFEAIGGVVSSAELSPADTSAGPNTTSPNLTPSRIG